MIDTTLHDQYLGDRGSTQSITMSPFEELPLRQLPGIRAI